MITTTGQCWTLNDPNGGLAMWENARHMPTWEESENYRIYLGLSVNRHYTYRVDQPCHVVTCDECGTPADPEGNDEFCHYPSRSRFPQGTVHGWALIGNTWCAAPASDGMRTRPPPRRGDVLPG